MTRLTGISKNTFRGSVNSLSYSPSPNKVKSTTPNQKESPLNKFPADFEFSPEYRVCMGQAEIDRIMKFTPSASTVRSQVAKSKDFQVRQSAELVRLGQG